MPLALGVKGTNEHELRALKAVEQMTVQEGIDGLVQFDTVSGRDRLRIRGNEIDGFDQVAQAVDEMLLVEDRFHVKVEGQFHAIAIHLFAGKLND